MHATDVVNVVLHGLFQLRSRLLEAVQAKLLQPLCLALTLLVEDRSQLLVRGALDLRCFSLLLLLKREPLHDVGVLGEQHQSVDNWLLKVVEGVAAVVIRNRVREAEALVLSVNRVQTEGLVR